MTEAGAKLAAMQLFECQYQANPTNSKHMTIM
jgi:hypothetical protein